MYPYVQRLNFGSWFLLPVARYSTWVLSGSLSWLPFCTSTLKQRVKTPGGQAILGPLQRWYWPKFH